MLQNEWQKIKDEYLPKEKHKGTMEEYIGIRDLFIRNYASLSSEQILEFCKELAEMLCIE